MLVIPRLVTLIKLAFFSTCLLSAILFDVMPASAQIVDTPTFDKFQVESIYQGAVHAPDFGDLNQYYGTDVRCFGSAAAAYSSMHVNFAGHFVLSSCSCGSGCRYLYMWDAATGKFFNRVPPGPAINVGPYEAQDASYSTFVYKGQQYQADSSLLIIEGCIEDSCECHSWYYRWNESKLNLLLRKGVRVPKKCVKEVKIER